MSQIPFTVYDFFGYLTSGFIVLVAIDYGFNDLAEIEGELTTPKAIFGVLLAYVLGHAVANLARTVIERWFVEKLINRVPTQNLMDAPELRRRSKLFGDYFRALAEPTRVRIVARAESADVREDPTTRDGARALRKHVQYRVRADEYTRQMAERFGQLRDFARNATMGCLIAAAIIGLAYAVDTPPSNAWGWALGALALAVLLLYRFLRFHRHYEAELLNAYAQLPRTTLDLPPGA